MRQLPSADRKIVFVIFIGFDYLNLPEKCLPLDLASTLLVILLPSPSLPLSMLSEIK